MINGEINLCFPKIGAPPIIQVIRQFCFNFSIETLKAHGFGVPPHLFGAMTMFWGQQLDCTHGHPQFTAGRPPRCITLMRPGRAFRTNWGTSCCRKVMVCLCLCHEIWVWYLNMLGKPCKYLNPLSIHSWFLQCFVLEWPWLLGIRLFRHINMGVSCKCSLNQQNNACSQSSPGTYNHIDDNWCTHFTPAIHPIR